MIGLETSARIFIYAFPIDGRLTHRGLADLATHTIFLRAIYFFLSPGVDALRR